MIGSTEDDTNDEHHTEKENKMVQKENMEKEYCYETSENHLHHHHHQMMMMMQLQQQQQQKQKQQKQKQIQSHSQRRISDEEAQDDDASHTSCIHSTTERSHSQTSEETMSVTITIAKEDGEDESSGNTNNDHDHDDNDDQQKEQQFLHDEEEGLEGPTCAICLDPFHTGDLICVPNNDKCNHIFHKDCMSHWLVMHSKCPICRENYLETDDSKGVCCK